MNTCVSKVVDIDEDAIGPPRLEIGILGWLKSNLFSSWLNTTITFICLWISYNLFVFITKWAVIGASFGKAPENCKDCSGACWSVIRDTWTLFLMGRYPSEERWRLLGILFIVGALIIVSFFKKVRNWRGKYYLWAFSIIPILILLKGVDVFGLKVVDTELIGGLLLTVLLSIIGLGFGFPLGVLLALGRRSRGLPIIKWICIVYIEVIRGIPIVSMLIIASILLPLCLPSDVSLGLVLRAQVGIILFSAGYIAEIIRGGLQGVPKAQEEAAWSIGLNYWKTMVFVILPQALRIVIPPLVSIFITFIKATSLVTVIGLFDLLGMAGVVAANPKWLGKIVEAYVFVAAIYWVICYSLSRYAMNIEKQHKAREH
ncbi:amino acid ABC transporter permease [Nitrosomonas sp. JL21]|uniref:amino acid ABC transporter permease n=1 Tax=Nitrosomonas sp. JL21 TaxID=153949 RepID=UPI00136E5E72|nr:amino acid ABC transporter permease [Nitrosomonas sp. JL21]MXS78456.1 amino acid ABC transporter permease [Nitrosomonas sp. JL21]